MNLQGWRYHIVGGDTEIEDMMDSGGAILTGIKDADIVLFTGGVDVNPRLYGEAPRPETQAPNIGRDAKEVALYRLALSKKKNLVGICRGAQLLNVLNGGRLWQHIDNHGGCTHMVTYYNEKSEKVIIPVTSDHHQMMRPTADARIWGIASETVWVRSEKQVERRPERHSLDPEIVFYKSTRSLCFQPHPEWGLAACKFLFFDCVRRAMLGG